MDHNCLNHNDIIRRVNELESNIRSLFSTTNKNAIAQATITTKLDNLLVSVGELKAQLTEINTKPSKRWELIIATIISVSISVSLAYILK